MACCSGTNVCSCVVQGDGSTTTVSGVGSNASPYVVTALIPATTPTPVTPGAGIGITGAGTSGSPYVITNTQVQSGDSIAAAVGVVTIPRAIVTNLANSASAGAVFLTGFVPQKSFTAGHMNIYTPVTTSPTAAFVGIYSVAANGDATLLCTSANTPSIGTAGVHNVVIPSTLLVAGNAYYAAILGSNLAVNLSSAPVINANLVDMTVQPMAAASNAGGSSTLPASLIGVGVNIFRNTLLSYFEITV